MAKKKDKKGTRIPKKIGGVKIPKQLRKQGAQLAEFARHPLVAELLSAGLVALTAKLEKGKRAAAATEGEAPAAAAPRAEPQSDLGRTAATMADVIAAKVSAKVSEGAARIIEAAEEGARRGARTGKAAPEGASKSPPKTAH